MEISVKAEKKLLQINKIGKLCLVFVVIFVIILSYLFFNTLPLPFFVTLLVIASLLISLPYFFLQRKYDKWYFDNVFNFIIDLFNKKEKKFLISKKHLNEDIINRSKVFQSIDLIESSFNLEYFLNNKKINISKVEYYNFIHHIINGQDYKQGRKLPVFKGIIISYKPKVNENFDTILVSNRVQRNKSVYSSLRLNNKLYSDGSLIEVQRELFWCYGNDSLNHIENSLDFKSLLSLSKTLIISFTSTDILIFILDSNYFRIEYRSSFVRKSIERDYLFFKKLKSMKFDKEKY